MEEKSSVTKKLYKILNTVGIAVLLLTAVLFIAIGFHENKRSENTQAHDPMIAGLAFRGEYRIGDGEWKPIEEDEHISSTNGDVTLRGYFEILDPTSNEPVEHLGADSVISLYSDHLKITLTDPLGYVVTLDTEREIFGEHACATMWNEYYFIGPNPETGSNIVTITLHNPHLIGNENAVDDFIKNVTLNPGGEYEEIMLDKGAPQRYTGIFIVIVSLIILGIAAFSSIIKINYSKYVWMVGIVSFFAGIYFIFESFSISLWRFPNIINTRLLGISMMMYMIFLTFLTSALLKKQVQRVGYISSLFGSLAAIILILVSFTDSIKFYDTWIFWALFEIVTVFILIACLAISIKNSTTSDKIIYVIAITTLGSFPLDTVANVTGWWDGGFVSKITFTLVFTVAIITVMRIIPSHITAAIRAKELETEQQALKLELQENRISIMLSQMQPHFIFNTLNTIYHLCDIDQVKAKNTINHFSEYLRNNIDNLGRSEMIPFEDELSFVKTYLDIEKIRFNDELEISYDISASKFSLPVLSVQPIVENAVKHGTSKKRGSSKLSIATRETLTTYKIIIKDTGRGFDTHGYQNDGHRHIGISNVRQRLSHLCEGTLEIESTLGVGTTATITIPKRRSLHNENNSG